MENVVFYAYYDDQLIYEQVIDSMVDGDEISLSFTLDPMVIQENPYMYHNITFSVLPKEGEMWDDNNYLEKDIWIYTHDEGYQILEDDYLFDCLTNENPEGNPIDAIIGPLSDENGIDVIQFSNFTLRNCLLSGWDTSLQIGSVEKFLVENNSFIGSFIESSLRVTASREGIVSNNLFSGNSFVSFNLDYSNDNVIFSNIFEGYYIAGLSLFDSDENNILNNLFRKMEDTSQEEAISINMGESNLVKENLINGGLHGIVLRETNYNRIEENIITNMDYNGIRALSDSEFNEILGNEIINTGIGIDLFKSSDNEVSNNYACNNVSNSLV